MESLVWLRSVLWTIPLCFGWTAVLVSAHFLSAPLLPAEGRAELFRFWARSMLWLCGARIRAVRGLEHLEPGRNYVFVSNHESLIDTPLLVAALPRALCFLAKKELFSVPFMGWYLRKAGHVPIERGDPRATLRSLAEAARVIAEERKSPLVFPEGTRSMNGELQEFKEGAALLAIRSGAAIAPVAVVGTRRILKAKGMAIRGGWIELRIGAPVAVDGVDQRRRGELMARVRESIERLRRGS